MRMHLKILLLCTATAIFAVAAVHTHAQHRPVQQPADDTASARTQDSKRQAQNAQKAQDSRDSMPDSMPGMDMSNGNKGDNPAESGAMHSMQPGHHMNGLHMRMTPGRAPAPGDMERADQIAATLRKAIEPYRDYHVALAEGFRIFMPNLPQAQYHFTNYWNGFVEGFTFDPAHPTSLLYKKTGDGYELVGAMYTAPRTATLDQLNERVPLSVADWHAHINLCMPKRAQMAHADWTKFGLTGSIATPEACTSAGGRFYPQVFGWMVHVYPFEPSHAKIWAQ